MTVAHSEQMTKLRMTNENRDALVLDLSNSIGFGKEQESVKRNHAGKINEQDLAEDKFKNRGERN